MHLFIPISPYHMWIFLLVENLCVVQLNVEILIHRVKGAAYCKIVLELNCHLQQIPVTLIQHEEQGTYQVKAE